MIFVGLMGGFAYVNIYKLILLDKRIMNNEKELSIGICKNNYYLN
jgi:hypothetical protein